MKMPPLISIIVPIFKVEQFLSRCIDSILNQTFTDFELLLIDDGSPDNSGTICDEYALKDKRIRVFHKKNGGVSSARNLGLDNAKGEWITFIDSDDWVKNNYLEKFCNNLTCDLIICGHQKFGCSNETQTIKQHDNFKVDSNLSIVWKNHAANQCFVYWYPWAKLYKNYIIQKKKIRFNTEMIYSEDFCFVLEYMSYINEYSFIASTDYQYYIEESRSNRYKMDFSTYHKHLVNQNESLKKIEKRCGLLITIRENLGKRFFNNFVSYILTIDNYKLYAKQMCLYKNNMKDLESLSLLPNNKRFLKFNALFTLPSLLSFSLLIVYKKLG